MIEFHEFQNVSVFGFFDQVKQNCITPQF